MVDFHLVVVVRLLLVLLFEGVWFHYLLHLVRKELAALSLLKMPPLSTSILPWLQRVLIDRDWILNVLWRLMEGLEGGLICCFWSSNDTSLPISSQWLFIHPERKVGIIADVLKLEDSVLGNHWTSTGVLRNWRVVGFSKCKLTIFTRDSVHKQWSCSCFRDFIWWLIRNQVLSTL